MTTQNPAESPEAPSSPLPTGPQVAVLVYPGVNELELGLVLSLLTPLGRPGSVGTTDAAALSVARTRGSVMCAGGLVCTPQLIFAAAPPALAGVLIPGGLGAQKAGRDPATREFLAQARAKGLPLGVCGSGVLLAGEAGLLEGRNVGCPAALADTVWGYLPADLQTDRVVHDTPADRPALYTGPGGLGGSPVILALISRLWGTEQAGQAAVRVGLNPPPKGP
ncbi:DJ-1/PfpI family protein [Deinococcus sp.]|uniref:DJ-1/PfpI family protein n=1 Tax=Deinococcus sp. TaxID=47478 RepID=UPI003C79AD8F